MPAVRAIGGRIAPLVLAAFLLTSCSSPDTDAIPEASATVSAEPTAEATTARATPTPRPSRTFTPTPAASGYGLAGLSPAETVYIGKLVQEHPRLREKSNDDLLGVGEVPCTLYDNGATSTEVNEFLFTAAGVAYLLDEFISIHRIGVAALCPEHIDKLG